MSTQELIQEQNAYIVPLPDITQEIIKRAPTSTDPTLEAKTWDSLSFALLNPKLTRLG
jgi:hypothetical protein